MRRWDSEGCCGPGSREAALRGPARGRSAPSAGGPSGAGQSHPGNRGRAGAAVQRTSADPPTPPRGTEQPGPPNLTDDVQPGGFLRVLPASPACQVTWGGGRAKATAGRGAGGEGAGTPSAPSRRCPKEAGSGLQDGGVGSRVPGEQPLRGHPQRDPRRGGARYPELTHAPSRARGRWRRSHWGNTVARPVQDGRARLSTLEGWGGSERWSTLGLNSPTSGRLHCVT